MKASMIVAAFAAIAATAGTVAALPTDAAMASPQPDDAIAAASVGRRTIAAKPVRLTVVNQSPQAIHTNPQDGWEGDLQPGESKDFHSDADLGGTANIKSVVISNYPAPQDDVTCAVTASNPNMGYPSMYANCYNAFTYEAVVNQWSYTKVGEGSCGYVTNGPGQHVYGHFCRGSDTADGYKHFIYYVYDFVSSNSLDGWKGGLQPGESRDNFHRLTLT